MTGDGRADLLALCSSEGRLLLFEGLPNDSFVQRQSIEVDASARDLRITDLNHDGQGDLLIVGTTSNALTVLLGTGDGGFGPAATYPLNNHSQRLALGDFNGDGHLDAATKNSGSGGFFNVGVLLGNGDGALGATTLYPVTGIPRDIAVGDVDSDGALDIAVAISTDFATGSTIDVFRGRGDGTFAEPYKVVLPEEPIRMLMLDVNHDSKPDLLVTYGFATPGYVACYLGNGDGTFASEQRFPVDAASYMIAGDIDGDGVSDLVVGSLSESLFLLKGRGVELFGPGVVLNSGSGPTSLAMFRSGPSGLANLAWTTKGNAVEILWNAKQCGETTRP